MQSLIRQLDDKSWPISTGPVVVFAYGKNVLNNSIKLMVGHQTVHSRDGPLIFHILSGPPNVTGPPGGTGPSPDVNDLAAATGPPISTG